MAGVSEDARLSKVKSSHRRAKNRATLKHQRSVQNSPSAHPDNSRTSNCWDRAQNAIHDQASNPISFSFVAREGAYSIYRYRSIRRAIGFFKRMGLGKPEAEIWISKVIQLRRKGADRQALSLVGLDSEPRRVV